MFRRACFAVHLYNNNIIICSLAYNILYYKEKDRKKIYIYYFVRRKKGLNYLFYSLPRAPGVVFSASNIPFARFPPVYNIMHSSCGVTAAVAPPPAPLVRSGTHGISGMLNRVLHHRRRRDTHTINIVYRRRRSLEMTRKYCYYNIIYMYIYTPYNIHNIKLYFIIYYYYNNISFWLFLRPYRLPHSPTLEFSSSIFFFLLKPRYYYKCYYYNSIWV